MASSDSSGQRSAAKRQRIQSGAAAGSDAAAAAAPLSGIAVFVRRNSLQSGAQLDAWKRSLPALGAAVLESEAACSTATHAVVPTGSKGGWACLPGALRPGSGSVPAGLHYVTEHWMAACIRSRARMPEHDFVPAAALTAPAAAPAAAAAAQAVAAAALPAVVSPAAVPPAAAEAAAMAEAGAGVAEAGGSCGPAESGSMGGGGGSDPEDSSGEEADLDEEEDGDSDPGRCSGWYAREAGQLVFAPERHADDERTATLLTWNIWCSCVINKLAKATCCRPAALFSWSAAAWSWRLHGMRAAVLAVPRTTHAPAPSAAGTHWTGSDLEHSTL